MASTRYGGIATRRLCFIHDDHSVFSRADALKRSQYMSVTRFTIDFRTIHLDSLQFQGVPKPQ
jgi:hypothetical protein